MDVTPETATCSRDGASVRRRLEPHSTGLVATVVVRTTTPSRVRIVDELPEGMPVETVTFDEETAPDGGRASPERVEATVAVTDATARFGYRLELSAAAGSVRIDRPTIDAVVRLDGDGTPGLGPAAGDRDGTDTADQHGETPATVATVEGRLDVLAERVERLAAGLDAGDEVPEPELSALESELDAVAGALESVRRGEPTVAERLADIERYRLAVASPDDDAAGDRPAVAPGIPNHPQTGDFPPD